MKTSVYLATVFLILLTGCRKSPPPPPVQAPAVAPAPHLPSRGPRTKETQVPAVVVPKVQWKHSPSSYKVTFGRLPSTVKARENLNFIVQVLNPDGSPATDLPNLLLVSVKSGPKGVSGFFSGSTLAKVVGGQATFANMQFVTPGDYVLEADLSGNRVVSGTLRVTEDKLGPKPIEGAGPAHDVRIQLDGKTLSAHYSPPGTYKFSNGDVYENVPFGESKAVIDGMMYSVTREQNDNLRVKSLGKVDAKTAEQIEQSAERNGSPEAKK